MEPHRIGSVKNVTRDGDMDLVDFVKSVDAARKRGCTTLKIYCKQCGKPIINMGVGWALDNLHSSISWGHHCDNCYEDINWNVTIKTTDLFGNEL